MFEFCSLEHPIVRREVRQLLTRAGGIGMLVQVSINAMELVGNVLRKVTLSLVRLTVVGVKKQLCWIFWVLVCRLCYPACQAHSRNYIFICGLTPHFISLTLFGIEQCILRIRTEKVVLEFFKNFPWNFSYFKKNWRDIMLNASMPFIK